MFRQSNSSHQSLRGLLPFLPYKKRENIHGGVLLSVKALAKA